MARLCTPQHTQGDVTYGGDSRGPEAGRLTGISIIRRSEIGSIVAGSRLSPKQKILMMLYRTMLTRE